MGDTAIHALNDQEAKKKMLHWASNSVMPSST
jgi:hypothetical protein